MTTPPEQAPERRFTFDEIETAMQALMQEYGDRTADAEDIVCDIEREDVGEKLDAQLVDAQERQRRRQGQPVGGDPR